MSSVLAVHHHPFKGNHVIKSLEVKNFRGYKSLNLSGFKRINVITGRNASGKTAFLEALYLALGAHPELYFKLRVWRGLGERIPIPLTAEIWEDLFFDFNTDNQITLSYKGTLGHTRSVQIYLDKESPSLIPVEEQIVGSPQPPLTFRWAKEAKRKKGKKSSAPNIVRAVFAKAGIRVLGTPEPASAHFFASSSPVLSTEVATWFGKLLKRDADKDALKAMQTLFPDIQELTVLPYAGEPMVFAKVSGHIGRIPLGLVSSGINRTFAFLMAIIENPNSAVLIDEIETGIHYAAMADLWKALFEFATLNGVQLFITSHSLEALRSVLPAMSQREDQFCLLQVKAVEGNCEIRYVGGADFEAALEEGVEVR